jgi:hypothetical protein
VDDRNAKAITLLTKKLFGKLFADKGYLSKALTDMLFGSGIQLITAVRKNMKIKPSAMKKDDCFAKGR